MGQIICIPLKPPFMVILSYLVNVDPLRMLGFPTQKKIIDFWPFYNFSKISPLGTPKPPFFLVYIKKNL